MDKTVPAGAAMLLDFIGPIEAPKGYDTIFGNRQSKLPTPITSMTLGDLIDAQKNWSNKAWVKKNWDPRSTTASSASGRYQIMRATLQDLVRELQLFGGRRFDANLQDRLGYHLLKRRGYAEFMAGKLSRVEFGKRLAQEWASLPVLAACKGAHRNLKRGESFYAGDGLNKVLVSPEKVEAVLKAAKAAGGKAVETGTPATPVPAEPIVIEKPVVADPGELETPPSKSKTVWTWLLTAIGAPIAAFGNLDWRVQLVIVGVIVGFAVYGIKRRNDLFRAVKDLRRELG